MKSLSERQAYRLIMTGPLVLWVVIQSLLSIDPANPEWLNLAHVIGMPLLILALIGNVDRG